MGWAGEQSVKRSISENRNRLIGVNSQTIQWSILDLDRRSPTQSLAQIMACCRMAQSHYMAPMLMWYQNCSVAFTWAQFHSLQWRRNEHNGSQIISLTIIYRLFMRRSPVTGEFPVQRANNAENVSIWWHHHVELLMNLICYMCLEFTLLKLLLHRPEASELIWEPYHGVLSHHDCLFFLLLIETCEVEPNVSLIRFVLDCGWLNDQDMPKSHLGWQAKNRHDVSGYFRMEWNLDVMWTFYTKVLAIDMMDILYFCTCSIGHVHTSNIGHTSSIGHGIPLIPNPKT